MKSSNSGAMVDVACEGRVRGSGEGSSVGENPAFS